MATQVQGGLPDAAVKRPLAWLDPALQQARWGVGESLCLILWLLAAGYAVAQHTPWADEAQAWMLAEGVGWRALFTHSLHYEGTGGLWHAFLKLLQCCGFSFRAMEWTVIGIQGAAVAVLLRFAPFPAAVRYLLPFTFFFFYQDTVVARSYCLAAVLVFGSVTLLRSALPRPWLLAMLLGLLANLSVHGALLSGGLAIVAGVLWKRQSRGMVPAAGLLLVFWLGAIATMIPAADIDYSAGNNIQRSIAKIERQVGMHTEAPPALVSQKMADLTPAPAVVHVRHGFDKVWNKVARTLSVITYPLASAPLLALLLVAGCILQAVLARQSGRPVGMLGFVPYLLMVAVFTSLYLAPRHVGMVYTGFLASAWLTWPTTLTTPRLRLVSRVTASLFVVMCVVQVFWSAHAVLAERRHPYAPGKMTADYLKSQGVSPNGGGKLAGFYYFSIDPLLYFGRNIYLNQPPHRYWYWSTTMRSYSTVEDVLAAHPHFIIIGGYESGPDAEIERDWQPRTPPVPGVVLNDTFGIARYFEANGYRPARVFCGHSWMRNSYAEELCDTVLEPETP